MKNTTKRYFITTTIALLAFITLTVLVRFVDRQPIGPNGSVVGFAACNAFFHRLTGVHLSLYYITDWLSIIPIAIVAAFGILGLMQWIKRRDIRRVDFDILILGGFYILVFALFCLFEMLEINYRPILIDGILEASYPSSTTVLVLCVFPTAILQLKQRMRCTILRNVMITLLYGLNITMLIFRILSGVHWLSDILGGIFLSIALVSLYRTLTE